jgi:hypothetical protein
MGRVGPANKKMKLTRRAGCRSGRRAPRTGPAGRRAGTACGPGLLCAVAVEGRRRRFGRERGARRQRRRLRVATESCLSASPRAGRARAAAAGPATTRRRCQQCNASAAGRGGTAEGGRACVGNGGKAGSRFVAAGREGLASSPGPRPPGPPLVFFSSLLPTRASHAGPVLPQSQTQTRESTYRTTWTGRRQRSRGSSCLWARVCVEGEKGSRYFFSGGARARSSIARHNAPLPPLEDVDAAAFLAGAAFLAIAWTRRDMVTGMVWGKGCGLKKKRAG